MHELFNVSGILNLYLIIETNHIISRKLIIEIDFMNRNFSFITSFIAAFFCYTCVSAQIDSVKSTPLDSGKTVAVKTDTLKNYPTYKIGIFAPLYLDSVFTDNVFRYRQGIPRFILPALDFIQGAQVALDSMPTEKENIEAGFYDSKAYIQNIPWLIENKKLDSLNFIIGNVKDVEYRQLADFALQKKIPFISATFPNDGGITANPYLLIVNSTLRSHCEAMYSYILQNHGTDRIFLCRKKGTQEDLVAAFFKQLNNPDDKPLLDIQTLNFDSDPTPEYIKTKLDSTRKTVIIGGSLDESFASKMALSCSTLNSTYPITLIGMPTWDGFVSLHKKSGLENFPVYFTTTYCNSKSDDFSKILMNAYSKKYKGKPSDMAFKGFELTRLFTTALTMYPKDFMNHINDTVFRVFNEYHFKPVLVKKENKSTDYIENKHLYFMKILNGVATRAW